MNSLSLGSYVLIVALVYNAIHEPPGLPAEDIVASFSRTIAIGTIGATLGAKMTGGSYLGAYLGTGAALLGSAILLPLDETIEARHVTQQALMTTQIALNLF